MLVLCYGITKSGSTLAFELVKGILETIGQPQVRLPGVIVSPLSSLNFLQQINREKLEPLMEYVDDHWVAVKTHALLSDSAFVYLEQMQNRGSLRVIASYRDPREICLSLADAGAKARSRGAQPFSRFVHADDAVPSVLRQIATFRRWGALSGALRLSYDMVAFAPDDAIDRIEQHLGVESDRERAKCYAFAEARTQKNKAMRYRAKNELPGEQYARLTETFSEFIQNVCEAESESWFLEARAQILAKLAARAR